MRPLYPSVLCVLCLLWLAGCGVAADLTGQSRETSARLAVHLVSLNDRNGDERLSRDEWAAMATDRLPRRVTESREFQTDLAGSFDAYDRNGDRFITTAEAQAQVLRMFDCQDVDHDGRLSFAESRRAGNPCNPRGRQGT